MSEIVPNLVVLPSGYVPLDHSFNKTVFLRICTPITFLFLKNHRSERFRRIHWKIIAIQLQTCCCTKKKNLITSVFQIILQIILEQLFCRWPADAYFYFWLTHWSLFIPPENIRKTLFFLYFQGLLNKTSSMKWINPFVPKHPSRFK